MAYAPENAEYFQTPPTSTLIYSRVLDFVIFPTPLSPIPLLASEVNLMHASIYPKQMSREAHVLVQFIYRPITRPILLAFAPGLSSFIEGLLS